MVGITSFGAYIPRLRLSRSAIAKSHAWLSPGLMGRAKGERALCNWDEDAVTMSVEAARDCLDGFAQESVDALYAASTTFPFADRLNAGIMSTALGLGRNLMAADLTSSQKAGSSALLDALTAAAGGGVATGLVTAADTRKTRAASTQELDYGDGAAAFLVGSDDGIARFLGAHCITADFIDHFRGEGQDFDYHWEERWIRDEGYSKLVPQAVEAALTKTGLKGGDINHFVLPCLFPRIAERVAKLCGISESAVRGNLSADCGETGTAHALLMLAHALEEAKPGEKILVAQFGQGCNALIFEATPALARLAKRRGVSGSLARRKEETNYMKLLTFKGMLDWEKGMRAERDNKTALTALYRNDEMVMSFKGGRCSVCGTAQYPRSRVCVNPNCGAVDTQEPYDFSDKKATILSWSADFLTFSMDPPQHYGMVTFEEGGRLLMDFTDVDQGTVDLGDAMRMVFRIKDFDDRRGFRRYFWKATPV